METPDLEELYRMVILDHARKPRNFGALAAPTVSVSGDNPTCGDQITLQLHLDPATPQQLDEVGFTGEGCSICMASASMMTQKIKKKTRQEAEAMLETFQHLLTEASEPNLTPEVKKSLGDLTLLTGVRKFPQRVKCATLAWQALKQALATTKDWDPSKVSGNGEVQAFTVKD